MEFPQTDRVEYEHNPLTGVVCQLRFAPILAIEGALPADFQQLIMDDYPGFEESRAVNMQLSPDTPIEVRQFLQGAYNEAPKRFEFSDESRESSISLSRDFVALATTHYQRWPDFRSRLERVVDALRRVYVGPETFTRVGLRYQNVLYRSRLGAATRWRDLLRPHLAGELYLAELADDADVVEARHRLRLKLDHHNLMVHIRHGIQSEERVAELQQDEVGYSIDADFFTEERTNADEVFDVLDVANREAGNLFRWCVSDELHVALSGGDG